MPQNTIQREINLRQAAVVLCRNGRNEDFERQFVDDLPRTHCVSVNFLVVWTSSFGESAKVLSLPNHAFLHPKKRLHHPWELLNIPLIERVRVPLQLVRPNDILLPLDEHAAQDEVPRLRRVAVPSCRQCVGGGQPLCQTANRGNHRLKVAKGLTPLVVDRRNEQGRVQLLPPPLPILAVAQGARAARVHDLVHFLLAPRAAHRPQDGVGALLLVADGLVPTRRARVLDLRLLCAAYEACLDGRYGRAL
mmetsp:Transcript_10784/g.27746  ORF Transcript_10784/g.27746 Transcript_10784/m.27746 type:complete len:249 (-) Transcript_10784:1949-2695(-)